MAFDRDPYLAVIRSTPPRCVEAFDCAFEAVPSLSTPNWVYSAWRLKCKCGGADCRLLAYRPERFIPDPDSTSLDFLTPLTYQCASCAKVIELFNADKHGYGAELGNGSCIIQGTGEPDQYKCPNCSGDKFNLQCTFIYPDALFDLIQDELEEGANFGYGDNVEDKFDQFSAAGTCVRCNTKAIVVALEVK